MANSKIGWCEALYKEGVFTRKVIVGKNGRKSYKYYDSDGNQVKHTDDGMHVIKQCVKEEYRIKSRAYNRKQLHLASIAEDPNEVEFASKEDEFSDYWNWD